MSEDEKIFEEQDGFEEGDIEEEIGCYYFDENALKISTKIVQEYEKPQDLRLFNGE